MENRSEITAVISVCCASDISVWKEASRHLIGKIDAKNYVVIVPDRDIEQFLRLSPVEYAVKPESEFVGDLKVRIEQRLPQHNRSRSGWYLQQFIKLAALKRYGEDGNVLIWDADTVLLKTLDFVDGSGRVRLFYCKEQHLPYFRTLKKLLDLDKVFRHSFIAQCFFVKQDWISPFFCAIEERQGLSWMEAILQAIDGEEISSFSEYETLGTFVMSRFPHDVVMSNVLWTRRGNPLIGDVSHINDLFARIILFPFSFVAFERWDRTMGFIERVRLRLKR